MEEKKIKLHNASLLNYAYNSETKTLFYIKRTYVHFDFKNMTCEEAFETINGEKIDFSEKWTFYNSQHDFIQGEKIGVDEIYCELTPNEIFQQCTKGNVRDDFGRIYSWIYKDGQAARFYLDEHVVSITKDGSKVEIEYDGGEIETYRSAEEVYQWNDYYKQNSDNKPAELVVAPKKKLRLTDEQRKVAERLSEAIKEAHAVGISVLYDDSDGTLNMVNGEHIESIGYDCGPHKFFGEDFERAGVITESIGWMNIIDGVTFELK